MLRSLPRHDRGGLLFAVVLFWLLTPALSAQAPVGDFECHALGSTVGSTNPDCEGWSDRSLLPSTTGAGLVLGADPNCPDMPSRGQQHLALTPFPGFSIATTPTVPAGNTNPIWPFTNGAVRAVSKSLTVVSETLSLDWMLLRSTNASRYFLEVLVIDPVTNQVITPVVVTDTTLQPFAPSLCPPPRPGPWSPPTLEATSLHSSVATLPASRLGQTVELVIVFGPSVGGSAVNPFIEDAAALVDNITFTSPAAEPITALLLTPTDLVTTTSGGVPSASATSMVTGYVDRLGQTVTDASRDPVIGATLTLSGSLLAGDANLNGAQFAATRIDIVATPGVDELALIGQFAQDAGRDRRFLSGSPRVIPATDRAIVSQVLAPPIRLATGAVQSPVLDDLSRSLGALGEELTLRFKLLPGTAPRFDRLTVAESTSPQVPEFNFDTDGQGSIVLGVAGVAPTDELFNVFVTNPTVSLGQGAFFGLEFTPLVADTLASPLGTIPFHVSPDADGAFFWGLPVGALPAGLVLDGAAGTVDPLTGFPTWISPVVRRAF